MLTPQQAADLDAEKADLADERRLVERLGRYGVGDQERRKIEAKLQEEWGTIPSRSDVAWTAANSKVAEAIQHNDYGVLSRLYWNMALQLYEEGRDHFEMSQLAKKYELLAMKRERDQVSFKVRVLGVCPESRADEGRLYTIEEALEEMPIPRPDCTHQTRAHGGKGGRGWCACAYLKELDL